MGDTLTLADLLAVDDGRRKFVFDGGEIGQINMYELTAEESTACFAEVDALGKKELGEVIDSVAKWAGWMVKGSEPTKAEIDGLRKIYSREFLIEMRNYGMTYSGAGEQGKAAAEKK